MTKRSLPTIETPRLRLRLPDAEAAMMMIDYFRRNQRHLAPWEPPFNRAMFTDTFWQRRLVQNQTDYRAAQSMRLVVFSAQQPQGPAIGMANFTRFSHGVFMGCNLGYSIDAKHQGQGLMYEALNGAIQFVFRRLNMHRVMANYIPSNQRSAKLLRRLGFKVEGYARDYLYINGAWRDHVLTAVTNAAAPIPEYIRATAKEKRNGPS